MIIYKVINTVNHKIYIGQSKYTMQKRKAAHIYDANHGCDFYFHRAIRKYGIDNFKWIVISSCNNLDSLNAYEKYNILFNN